ncbi:MAG: DUF296 domain-containing protein [bacterium]
MITVASHQARTILGRFDKGADLVQGLLDVCRARAVRCGTVSALGALESVELAHYDTKNKRYLPSRIVAGPLEILSVVGNLSERKGELALHVHITVSREGDNGIEVLGGHVLAARVFACEFAITALDDVLLRRGSDRVTGLPLWKEGFESDGESVASSDKPAVANSDKPAVASSDKPAVASSSAGPAAEVTAEPEDEEAASFSWSDVAAASAEAQRSGPVTSASGEAVPAAPSSSEPEDDAGGEEDEGEEDADYIEVAPGDVIEHPRFGVCKVERVEGDDEYVQVRLRNRNLVRLSLDIVTLSLVGHEGGHQVFKAIIDG